MLAPPGFSDQNLICALETGEIKAFIGWDKASTVPRYIREYLRQDWLTRDYSGLSHYHYPRMSITMHVDDHKRHRDNYARYLREACEMSGEDSAATDDWKYTAKSPVFEQVVGGVLTQSESRIRTGACQIFEAILLRVDVEEFMIDVMSKPIGQGMENMIKDSIMKFSGTAL
jgi:hypothetical protein